MAACPAMDMSSEKSLQMDVKDRALRCIDCRDDELVCVSLGSLRKNSSSGGKFSRLESMNGFILLLLLVTVCRFEDACAGGFIGDGVSTVT